MRTNVFYTKSTSQGNVCMIIIDSESFYSVVSTDTVQKFNLKIVSHPHPYKLRWLQNSNEIKVSKHCLISLSIEKNIKIMFGMMWLPWMALII